MKVNIFTPTYHRFDMTKRSLESIIPFVNSSVYDTTLYICDNNSPPEMQEWLKTLIDKRVKVFLSEKNIGKAAIVNKVYAQNSECTHIISIDSDMIADEEYNFIDGMVWCIEHFNDFGLLSTFQKGKDCQLWRGLTEKVSLEKHEICYGRYNCVAGGCIILKKEIWESIGGYCTEGKVYGFDDAIMMQDIHTKLKKKVGVINTVKLTHPYDDDKQYQSWKLKNVSSRKSEGFYDQKN